MPKRAEDHKVKSEARERNSPRLLTEEERSATLPEIKAFSACVCLSFRSIEANGEWRLGPKDNDDDSQN